MRPNRKRVSSAHRLPPAQGPPATAPMGGGAAAPSRIFLLATERTPKGASRAVEALLPSPIPENGALPAIRPAHKASARGGRTSAPTLGGGGFEGDLELLDENSQTTLSVLKEAQRENKILARSLKQQRTRVKVTPRAAKSAPSKAKAEGKEESAEALDLLGVLRKRHSDMKYIAARKEGDRDVPPDPAVPSTPGPLTREQLKLQAMHEDAKRKGVGTRAAKEAAKKPPAAARKPQLA